MALRGLFQKKGTDTDELLDTYEPERVADININVGSSGILNVETVDKSAKYETLLGEVTPQIIRDIARVFEGSKTKTQAFTKLDDLKISLEYLIALGITTEEQVYAYQVIRQRGILEEVSSNIQKVGSTVDEDYAMEILELERKMPDYKNNHNEPIQESLTIRGLYDQQLERMIELETEIRQLELKRAEDRAQYEEFVKQGEEDEDTQYDKGIFSALEQTQEVDLFDLSVKTDEEEQQIKEVQSWQDALSKLQQRTQQEAQQDEIPLVDDSHEDHHGEPLRIVYILSSVFELPEIEGYEFNFIEKPVDLNYFTTSKDNLLVITDNIPRYIVTIFVNWINGIGESDTRYRIVTLEGSELTHALIEGAIQINKESLDDYYDTHELERYTGSGVGSFLDISHLMD